ncbi:hypothetical protein BDV96DRAFT_538180 [Lophiotrema nucula]|uniref:Postreplication repair E3 ubiquitin-protein ligase RAD18 n=1 Tax=Lophiotrema nucula TaxID=690887 RepID=A0A6A5ZQM6_9PLEO|nr:hypothetical protein BDV96DRAFT_538180 [Lophiotrema nucula]
MDSSFDLPDSTDWIATSLPSFEPLEASLRCEVCKEFYNNPVITQCAHTFCSICIRRCITADGKCPACKSGVSSERLVPNIAVREIVKKFQEARPKALDLARHKHDETSDSPSAKKRKLDDTDLEQSEGGRQTRSRRTKSSRRGDGLQGAPIQIPDTDDDDGDFEPDDLPEGMVRCPICQKPMKEEQVFSHLNNCPDTTAQTSETGRGKRSRSNNAFSKPSQQRRKPPPKQSSPAPSRLPQLNYHLLKEPALKKKLQEIGIPVWGKKELLERRHLEWLHIWNSNCDSENPRNKRELLKELDTWEQTRGGRAQTTEARVMRKDFDAQGHATMHKNQFDDLIANARRKRESPKSDEVKEEASPTVAGAPDAEHRSEAQPTAEFFTQDVPKPLEGCADNIASIREKVELVNRTGDTLASVRLETISSRGMPASAAEDELPSGSSESAGIANPFTSPSRKVPMFALPEDPVVDVDNSTQV